MIYSLNLVLQLLALSYNELALLDANEAKHNQDLVRSGLPHDYTNTPTTQSKGPSLPYFYPDRSHQQRTAQRSTKRSDTIRYTTRHLLPDQSNWSRQRPYPPAAPSAYYP